MKALSLIVLLGALTMGVMHLRDASSYAQEARHSDLRCSWRKTTHGVPLQIDVEARDRAQANRWWATGAGVVSFGLAFCSFGVLIGMKRKPVEPASSGERIL